MVKTDAMECPGPLAILDGDALTDGASAPEHAET
jgi:hypothetical protein